MERKPADTGGDDAQLLRCRGTNETRDSTLQPCSTEEYGKDKQTQREQKRKVPKQRQEVPGFVLF